MQLKSNGIKENFLDKEWLCSNGIGGYASSTISGANTRRYHGLLVASFNPPAERRVLVSRVEEVVTQAGNSFELGCSQYKDLTVNPKGYDYLNSCDERTAMEFAYSSKDWKLKKKVFMPYGYNATVIEYTNNSGKEIELAVTPFLTYRDYHQLLHQNDYFDFDYEKVSENRLKIYPCQNAAPLFMEFSKGNFALKRNWYNNHFYRGEAERGFDAIEDTLAFGTINVKLGVFESLTLVFSTEESVFNTSPLYHFRNNVTQLGDFKNNYSTASFLTHLIESANKFVVKRQTTNEYTILAGYHWFLDWGRDTLIALRGIGIATGNKEISKSILKTFLKYLDKGMLPNRFPDEGEEPEYNSVDASLWLFVTMYEYYLKFDDKEFIREHFDALTSVIKHYSDGTRYAIHLTGHGFISAGEGDVQLTWMDARVDGKPITPRHGCSVEINALWYNALNIYQVFKNKLGVKGLPVKTLINKFEKNFEKHFYNAKGYLNDVVIPTKHFVDDSIRPNQIYALSLPFNLLGDSQKHSVLNVVKEHLFTPYGLRSLSPSHPDFVSIYTGSPSERDACYHQGTVWAFLVGEYYSAELMLNNYSRSIKKEILNKLEPLKNHFYDNECVRGVSEIFDGQYPLKGKGTVHQAWSVGALIDVLIKIDDKG